MVPSHDVGNRDPQIGVATKPPNQKEFNIRYDEL